MNQKERRAARGLQIVAVCCCFCLLAVGAGVTYRAMDREKAGGGETLQKEQPVFAAPLEGETKVVLAYSTDHAIYDPTLEQYRTNASVSLSAKEGTEVKAAADGVVKEVKKDAQAGNLVRIAHGEDWLTTYGQLADAVAVKEGESVKRGQRIGTVAAPTKYGVALGEHLIFAMEQNGEPQNPMEKMKTAE